VSADPASCPVCGSARRSRTETVADFRIAYCAGCRSRWLDPIPTTVELHSIYEQGYFESDSSQERGYGGGENAAGIRRTNLLRLAQLRALLPSGGRLLEIGSGRGDLGTVLSGDFEFTGLELSAEGAAVAQSRGLDVQQSDVESFRTSESFDAVVLVHVFEHLPQPRSVLARIAGLLRPGGLLYLVTPDTTSFLARMSGARWVSYKFPEHVILYSRQGLTELLAESGFETVSISADQEFVDHPFLLSRLRRLSRLMAVVARALLIVAPSLVRVPSGAMRVVARRRG
jgi:2-polyprenyl-3-methyl-5-hydroxy-6-metoxy-1,4-benzoquinol methylase